MINTGNLNHYKSLIPSSIQTIMVENNNKFAKSKKTHFIMVPILDKDFLEAYNKLSSKLTSQNLKDFHEELLQKPTKLHFTVCTLTLLEDDKIKQVEKALSAIDFGSIVTSLSYNVNGFASLQDDISKTRVVYAKLTEDENFLGIKKLVHTIVKTLWDAKLISQSDLDDSHIVKDKDGDYTSTIHLTLLNIMFLNKFQKKNKIKVSKVFDATEILKSLDVEKLPSPKLTEVQFCVMEEDKSTQKYKLIKSYQL